MNFFFIFGCPTTLGVLADSNMVYELRKAVLDNLNRDSMITEIPSCFDGIDNKDANYETIISN